MKKMTRIFREAARIIAANENAGQMACAAIWRAQGEPAGEFGREYESPEHDFLHDLFLPTNGYFSVEGDTDEEWTNDSESIYTKAANDRRILALLLLAAMSEAGDLT